MKKKLGLVAMFLCILFIGLLFSTGGKMGGVGITDYSISEDGDVMTLKVSVISSMGYIRTLKEHESGNKKWLTFYSTYGLNNAMGAKNEFQVKLHPSCDEIYVYSGPGEYKLALKKDSGTNEWEKAWKK